MSKSTKFKIPPGFAGNNERLEYIRPYRNDLHCLQTYNVFKFQPEKLNFTACCDTESIPWNQEIYDQLGDDYFMYHPALLKRQEDLKNNIKPLDCIKCWTCEEHGLPSARLRTFDDYNATWGTDVTKFWPKEKLNNETNFVKRIEIWPESTCNLGCHMCHIGNSTILQKIWSEDHDVRGNKGGVKKPLSNGHPYIERYLKSMKNFISQCIKANVSNTLTIAYLGGEPTIQQSMYTDAKELIEMGKYKAEDKILVFSVVTNGNAKPSLNNKLLNLYRDYRKNNWTTSIMVSQDAVGDQAQIRHLSNPEIVKNNFCSYIASPYIKDITSFTVLSNMSLPYIDKMAKYISDSILNTKIPPITTLGSTWAGFPFPTDNSSLRKKININFNTLTNPDWMMLRYLPKKYAIDAVKRAIEIFEELEEKHDKNRIDLMIKIENLKQQSDTLKEDVPINEIKTFLRTTRYIESVYSKYYPNYNFDNYFPHLKQIRSLYE